MPAIVSLLKTKDMITHRYLFITSFLLINDFLLPIKGVLITTPGTGVKFSNIQGHKVADIKVPSQLSCSGNEKVKWIKVDVQVSLFIFS